MNIMNFEYVLQKIIDSIYSSIMIQFHLEEHLLCIFDIIQNTIFRFPRRKVCFLRFDAKWNILSFYKN